jgi:DNA invertase Pin-like site-specific DNA recombinase
MEKKEDKIIKYVAMYLRKSRGDIDTDLEKHRTILKSLCDGRGYVTVEYIEIGSGDSIYARPVFQRLLKDIEEEDFDAVAVVDIDRLGRGDMGDQDRIKKAFIKSDTVIITPQQIYNLSIDNDEFQVDFRSFMARSEYKQIVKRLSQGKKIGAKLGMWTNGTPPYPYEYEKWGNRYKHKGLVINDDKLKVYRFIIDSFIKENKSPETISIELNKNHILSPKGKFWTNTVVRRLLFNETHLGKIISNKTKGDYHKRKPDSIGVKQLPKSEWLVIENCHEAVKTQEEHDLIMLHKQRLKCIPRREYIIIKPLSKLLKCGLCGYGMSIGVRGGSEYIETCQHKSHMGEKCTNSGLATKEIYPILNQNILNYKEEIQEKLKNRNTDSLNKNIDKQIIDINQNLQQIKKTLERVSYAYDNGGYTFDQYMGKKKNYENESEELTIKLKGLQIEKQKIDIKSLELKYENLINTLNKLNDDSLSGEEKNKCYKSIIEKIIYTRIGDNVSVEVKFK